MEGGVFLMIRGPPRATQGRSSAASDVYKRQGQGGVVAGQEIGPGRQLGRARELLAGRDPGEREVGAPGDLRAVLALGLDDHGVADRPERPRLDEHRDRPATVRALGIARDEAPGGRRRLGLAVGLGERLSHTSDRLSGGERQRVAIARALVNNPSLILADEPTGNLDSKSGQEIMQIIASLHHEGRTVILITHDPSLPRYGQRLIVVKDGQIIEEKKL